MATCMSRNVRQPLKAGDMEERDLQVKIARGLKGRRTLQRPMRSRNTSWRNFTPSTPDQEYEFYLERSAILWLQGVERLFLAFSIKFLPCFSFTRSFAGQPEQAIKEKLRTL